MPPTGDLNQDGIVNSIDLSILVSRWNSSDADADLNGDGIVDTIDLSTLVGNWGATSSSPGTALLLTNESTLSPGHQNLSNILTAAGYTVIPRLFSDPEDYTGIDVVVVSTGNPEGDSGTYVNPPVGIVAVDAWRPLGMGTNLGFENNTNPVEVVDAVSPLAAGVSGAFNAYLTPRYITWEQDLSANPSVVVTRPSQPGQAVVFAYESGDTMISRFATTRHVALGYHEDGLEAGLTTEAESQLLAAVAWARATTYTAPPPPSAPTGVVASASNAQATISWSGVSGADSYTVKRSTTDGGPYTTVEAGIATTGYTDINLTNGTTYYYVVSATNTQGEGQDSTQVSVVPVEGGGGGEHFFYSNSEVDEFINRMSGAGPFYSLGDASHGGQYSPGDGERAITLKNNFLTNPGESYFTQTSIPINDSSDQPLGERYQRFMQAAWCFMTQPNAPDHSTIGTEVKNLLLWTANEPSLDHSDSNNYPLDQIGGFAPGFLFWNGAWATRILKARDMLGRDYFTSAENDTFDEWLYGVANWYAKWLHQRGVGQYTPGRLDRDYSTVNRAENAVTNGDGPNGMAKSYDGGPGIGLMGLTYTNRHIGGALTLAQIANYLNYYGYAGSTKNTPSFGVYSITELLHHSRLFAEETIRFATWPEGFQGDFERGDQSRHTASTQQGWRYAINVSSCLVDMAHAHALNNDMSLWNYGTTAGYDGSAGSPNVGGFNQKSIHFLQWALSRYVNDGWGRRNYGDFFPQANHYHDVMPAAITHRFFPSDSLLNSAWRRSGDSFPDYPSSPQSQGPWNAWYGEGARMIGLIEVGDL